LPRALPKPILALTLYGSKPQPQLFHALADQSAVCF
jgi:hypothetical protein